MFQFSKFSEKLALLLAPGSEAHFSQRMIDLLRSLVPIDDATIMIYPPRRLPEIDYYQPLDDGSTKLDQFVKAAFLLDPYYIAATKLGYSGFFHLKDISPDEFRLSEYYKSFYCDSGYQDECGYIIPFAGDGFAQISLARTGAPAKFTENELKLLQQISGVIENLGGQHWSHYSDSKNSDCNLRIQLHRALEEFGSSLLTDRQMQVINFLLHGHSTKLVAERLEISIETVKLHRKHAYAKLGINSQGELFYLFLDSLMSSGNYVDGDTLATYLRPPE